jgi:serine/threonine protein kinase
LVPQTILVKDGFKRGSQIKVQLSHLGAIIISQSMHQGYNTTISGVDRLYLAPELNYKKMGPKNDVWSIGIILYLLVTGGVNDKRHEERFDFKEPVWYNVSEELKEFMLMALNQDLHQRASVEQLLATDFIEMAK